MSGLLDSDGKEVVNYVYDSWGNPLSIGGSLAGTVGAKNPFRYRGYYYDAETGLYLLQWRYYDPEIGWFISRDDASCHDGETGIEANLYAYCDNNPISNYDLYGTIYKPSIHVPNPGDYSSSSGIFYYDNNAPQNIWNIAIYMILLRECQAVISLI